MIPSLDKPKYKPLIRLRADVWNNLQKKNINKKKWRFLISLVKKKTKRLRGKIPKVRDYFKREVSKFPVYARYKYQKSLGLRLHIRFIYGRLQNYKIKQIALRSKKKSWLGYTRNLEQNVNSFLYRAKLVITYGEAKIHHKRDRIYVNGNSKEMYLIKGDILHFQPDFEEVLKKRFLRNYLFNPLVRPVFQIQQRNKKLSKVKKKFLKTFFGIHTCVDFDSNSFRFLFINKIKYFKNHPFRVPFEKIIRWYTRV
ncbi:MAG TPA: hypothetical protein VIV55_08350 [Flavobacterium sp.]